MPRGKKSSPEVIYKIMSSWAVTNNLKETARQLNLPLTTVKGIVDKNRDVPEFVALRNEKKRSFSEAASEIIDKGLILLNRRFSRALSAEEELDALIDEIYSTPGKELSQDEKSRLVNKIRSLQLQDVKSITTAVGTLYDKKALADGNSTDNVSVSIKLPEGIEEYAE